MREHFSAGAHSFLLVNNREPECRGTLFSSSISTNAGTILCRGTLFKFLPVNNREPRMQGYTVS